MMTSTKFLLPRQLKSVSGAFSRARASIVTKSRTINVTSSLYSAQVSEDQIMKIHDYTADKNEIEAANKRYRGILEVKDSKYGRGVFALRDFRRGDMVVSANAVYATNDKDSHTVQTDWDAHALMDVPATLINHSCSANVGPKDNEKGCYDWHAMKSISKGEELFSDYESFENKIEGFDCSCGTPECRGTLGGFSVHGDQLLNTKPPGLR